MITIELAVLQAALLTSAKQDIRYYLNGVYITQNKLVSTDGHRMFAYDLQGCKEFKPFIIPSEAITQLVRSLTAKQRKIAQVELTVIDGRHQMESMDSIVVFQPIDGTYPNYERVIPAKYEPSIHGTYNWQYMFDFSKISKLLGDKFGTAKLLTNANGSSIVELPDDNATCVIMPMRED